MSVVRVSSEVLCCVVALLVKGLEKARGQRAAVAQEAFRIFWRG